MDLLAQTQHVKPSLPERMSWLEDMTLLAIILLIVCMHVWMCKYVYIMYVYMYVQAISSLGL